MIDAGAGPSAVLAIRKNLATGQKEIIGPLDDGPLMWELIGYAITSVVRRSLAKQSQVESKVVLPGDVL